MNWRQEATGRLRRYEGLRHALHNIPLQLRQLKQAAGTCQGEDKLLNNIVSRQLLERSLENTRYWLRATEDALSCLDPVEQLILRRLYIYPEKKGMDRLCRELGVERSQVYRRRDQALEKFTIALFGEDGSPGKLVS